MEAEFIRLTVRCGNTGRLIDIDYEDINFIDNNTIEFYCYLCREAHSVILHSK